MRKCREYLNNPVCVYPLTKLNTDEHFATFASLTLLNYKQTNKQAVLVEALSALT